MRMLRLGINFYKVLFGVGFSLLWARVMYMVWQQPSFITFIWFYLVIGSLLLKWVFFELIDRIDKLLKLRAIKKELKESDTRIQQVIKDEYKVKNQNTTTSMMSDIDLQKKMKHLEDNVLALAKMVETAVKRSFESLKRLDMDLARQVIENDKQLDNKEFAIRQDCMNVLSTGALQSDDLNMIVAVLGIITELERMGDYAEGIANITLMIGKQPHLKQLLDIPTMVKICIEMLQKVMKSFLDKDMDKAKSVSKMDDDVDALYDHTFRELLFSMIENPDNITQATRLIWVTHNLERFADRVTNICEWVVFGITGKMVDIGASKY